MYAILVTYTGGNTVDTKWTLEVNCWDDDAMKYRITRSKRTGCPHFKVGGNYKITQVTVYPTIKELVIFMDRI